MSGNSDRLRQVIAACKQRLASGRDKLRRQHDSGSHGVQVCASLTDLVDGVLLDLFAAVCEDMGPPGELHASRVALVAHGGFGRRDLAPFSDVDLMLLMPPRSEAHVEPLARKLSQSIFDCGLQLGFSVRTAAEACQLAISDAQICTSLTESRFLVGSVRLFTRFASRFQAAIRSSAGQLIAAIETARREEWNQFGGTVNLLEPNIKRSRGGLRDIQLVRWVGAVRYGECDPEALQRADRLSKADFLRLRDARDFLLRVRNELHFHAGKAHDTLEKAEQLRIAAKFGYEGDEAILPVERFMRTYFELTNEVRQVAAHVVAGARARHVFADVLYPLISHQFERDFRVGPQHIKATSSGMKKVATELEHVLRLLNLANLYDKRIDHDTWEAIRTAMSARDDLEITPAAIDKFLELMAQPGALGDQLRSLHELRVLEKLIPAVAHARCLMQFNEYHKYTVDEHSIRAVQAATEFMQDSGPLGEAYRSLRNKRVLHLALLIHDLGKGYVEDHSDVGKRIAGDVAKRFALPPHESEALVFLVYKHLVMAHLAFRRDLNDEKVIVQFAVEIGSPELLQMLYLLTAADLAAVGPGVLNHWKLELLTELYRRTMRYLTGDAPGSGASDALVRRRDALRVLVKDGPDRGWWQDQIEMLPAWYLFDDELPRIHAQLDQLRKLPHNEAVAWGRFVAERSAVEYTIGTYEEIAPGIFHRLTGALSSKGMQILSASIATLAGGLVLDRFFVTDADFSGVPPLGRLQEVCQTLVAALKDGSGKPPVFRRVWQTQQALAELPGTAPADVKIDNSTSERFTILEIFASDRRGLLYAITRALFELGLSVHVAKISTVTDQALDVFYVTDLQGRKLDNEVRLEGIRQRLLKEIDTPA